nr:MAG TPA: Peptidyl-tRNA hydrolase [Caudoviricetes sp.]
MTKFNYKEQHAVIVRCDSEEEQREIFEQLKSQGITDLKIVSV